MAAISEIFQNERDREDKSKWNVIHLFKEGNFYHAYEWSAWLIANVTYNNEAREKAHDKKGLSVTHKRIKDSEDTFAFVGFPLNSIDKYIPKESAMDFQPVSDTLIDISVELPVEIGELSLEAIQDKIQEWKNAFSVKEKEPRKNSGKVSPHELESLLSERPLRLTEIIGILLAYPIEKKSPIEVVDFVSQLKEKVAAMI